MISISGGNSERDPPVPIPNTEVKPLSADGTWLATARESKTSPDSIGRGKYEKNGFPRPFFKSRERFVVGKSVRTLVLREKQPSSRSVRERQGSDGTERE